MSDLICLTSAKLYLRVVKKGAKYRPTMKNDVAELIVIIAITIKSIYDDLGIKRKIYTIKPQFCDPLKCMGET